MLEVFFILKVNLKVLIELVLNLVLNLLIELVLNLFRFCFVGLIRFLIGIGL